MTGTPQPTAATASSDTTTGAASGGFDGVLFDCDGVLVDSELITNGVLREMLHELGWAISAEDCIRLFIGRALKDEWEVILDRTGFRITDEWIGLFRERRDERLRAELSAIPGAREAVAAASERFAGRIAVATGADLPKARMQLELTGLAPLFGGRVLSGMDQPRSKPAPDVYLAAAAAVGIDADRAIVVEDTVSGTTAGVAAGATVLGFSPEGPTRTAPEALRAAGAAAVFTRMDELPGLIDSISRRVTN
ncbi:MULTISPECIES: HAD family hydrolase [unclassified Leucobacter]|uniref:HAD family hydrolase n=1 Tax=unclassified Leucobacter TaxID=2621730 RepID=UPI000A07D0C5|nr:HAD family phosphatase [Leucobacter sp. Ag1]